MQYNGNRNYSSSPYNEMNGRHPGYNDHGAYNQSQNPNSNQGMDFSRAVSSSFAENNKDQHIPPPSFDNDILDQRDDISIGDDASWKNGLYQVASIEEDKFEARQVQQRLLIGFVPTCHLIYQTQRWTRKEPRHIPKRTFLHPFKNHLI
jgi:hypothetical protein